jgi:hypothetical protein
MKIINKIIYALILIMALLPVQAFANGTHGEHQREMLTSTYVLIGSGILFAFFFVIYLTTKNRKLKWAWILSLLVTLVSGAIFLSGGGEKSITIHHVHGLGYTHDGKRILIPSHYGLRVYSEGRWGIPEGEAHDYMGFSMVDDGFYSSGHPAEGSNLPDPLGVVKSMDEGQTIEVLDLLEESDFHGMAVGYKTHTIYVFNSFPNSKMDTPGMYYTKDETKTWVKSELNGFNERPTSMAVHPTEEGIVAVGTETGVYLSRDYGQNFEKVHSDLDVTSLFFNITGQLFVGGVKTQPLLIQLNIGTLEAKEINVPTIKEDAIAYFAQNPVNENELVFATFNKDIYISGDSGQNWTIIADKGEGISQGQHGGHDAHQGESEVLSTLNYDGKLMNIKFEDAKGAPIKEFEIAHEKYLHLIVISEDLKRYYHLHPTFLADGTFELKQELPTGTYKAFADAKPVGYAYQVKPIKLEVGDGGQAAPVDLVPDTSFTQTIDGVTVSMEPTSFPMNEEITLDFRIEGSQPEPYLGALGHVVILDDRAEQYVHVHPISETKPQFSTQFTEPGIYKIWAEFKFNGKVHTYPYVIEVK